MRWDGMRWDEMGGDGEEMVRMSDGEYGSTADRRRNRHKERPSNERINRHTDRLKYKQIDRQTDK
jgi:hypothetical protein